ncbi:GerAB/ArcD/ProY family transporter [Rossellomorea yichunensis]|uniref:GerAB/ArcD/ProY family transporter n=1 Tax=Rossellomorea yichunensis TaxID=3077331 RepID=UPI0028DF39F6|nr:GerAB/ArcD/ProY family transporter [Rossellomorea sp. YC4-1]MDT9027811.1 GerAB/ArcD/ProY family transporter [Rossellomorea sp. YC4-1]
MSKTESLTNWQLFFLLIQSQVGFSILVLPNILQSTSKGDSWISVLLAGVAIQLFFVILWLLFRKFPNLTYTEITLFLLGKHLGSLVNIVIYLYFIVSAALILLQFTSVIKEYLLMVTPYWVIGLLMLLTCTYLAISDIRIIARFFGIISLLFLCLFGISFFSFLLPLEIHHILPIGSSGIKGIFLGSKDSLLALLGFEVILFLYPLAEKKGTSFLKVITWANVFVTLLTAYFVFICIMIFSEPVLKQIKYPVFYFLRPLHFQMVERLDILFISIWIVPLGASLVIYLYLCSKSLTFFKGKPHKLVVISSALVFSLFTFAKKDPESLKLYVSYLEYFSYTVIFALPCIFLLFPFITKKPEKEEIN